ncbi:carboxylating nicotinate-nucleotide diphosphorylase [Collinsella sp. AGMB00827]|uniref:nicotinate-nucleotide diphosphorylase (carboxylating) n=1 Tax=Collinsella ureilytica TaxID=2869515 RepID=A0ABS7MKM4_9ACTN|nr:carboxylating nicotinate-nucleotide diphosphorylase [Collinsella urealyticum]MBY4797631.1 carboxylating nicotinate-nucleotide diphosphorylase [Collinsella urealyticum]
MNPITQTLVADNLILQALKEDITYEDVSVQAVCPHARAASVELIAKQDGIIAGLDVFERVFFLLDATTVVDRKKSDGDEVQAGNLIAFVRGDARVLLAGERVALNFLQRMSGIATRTAHMVKALNSTKTRLVDTRKTCPNMRIFEREAVRIGGGSNHRFNLSSAVMLKDNHIDAAGSIRTAVCQARQSAPITCMIEVECENLEMVSEALEAKADIIMLDNMDTPTMAKAVALINERALIEASGNIDEQRIRELADLGVDFISSGALTHSAGILDLSMKHLRILDTPHKVGAQA